MYMYVYTYWDRIEKINVFSFVFLFCTVLLRHVADRGSVIIKIIMRKQNSCPNYRKFQISEVRISEVSLYSEDCVLW
jgi:hypothetical protein